VEEGSYSFGTMDRASLDPWDHCVWKLMTTDSVQNNYHVYDNTPLSKIFRLNKIYIFHKGTLPKNNVYITDLHCRCRI
jgi:hypothetical protein